MPNIYDQHRAAFANVSAFVILHNGENVATIALKYPRDGAGRLYAYVHWISTPMVRGFASGCGYDKQSAACAAAARKLPELSRDAYACGTPHHDDAERAAYDAFRSALSHDSGRYWYDHLRDEGFVVVQAV